MTDRGLPIADGAPACPFVAFDDDRDERATSPDHRHRCYAEVRPAPRAVAHQEAYCLSSAFPVCPTFQDWARREAAHARGGGEPAQPEPARRNAPREWSAPPPWLSDEEAGPRGREGSELPEFLAGRDRPGGGLAGSAADRIASASGAAAGASAAGAAASAPHGHPAADEPGEVGSHDGRPWERAWTSDEPDDEPELEEDDEEQPTERSRRVGGAGALFGDRRPRVGQTRPRKPANDLSGPAWERPRRHEAYPTLRTRFGMPRVPPVAIAAVALVIAAVALFFLPQLLGVGTRDPGDGVGGVPTGSPSASMVPSSTPSATPAPTPVIYIVKTGDTLSGIATAHDVSIEELLAANPNITNPDEIAIGDPIVIPTGPVPLPSELEGTSPGPAASPSP